MPAESRQPEETGARQGSPIRADKDTPPASFRDTLAEPYGGTFGSRS